MTITYKQERYSILTHVDLPKSKMAGYKSVYNMLQENMKIPEDVESKIIAGIMYPGNDYPHYLTPHETSPFWVNGLDNEECLDKCISLYDDEAIAD